MRFIVMFIAAVCVLFPVKLWWPKRKSVDHRFWFVVSTKEYMIKKKDAVVWEIFVPLALHYNHTVASLLLSAYHHADVLYFLKDLKAVC